MAPNHKRHAAAEDGRWGLLGEHLQARRQELGFKFRPAFARERLPLTDDGNPNTRLVADIENSYRAGSFPPGTLRLLAQAYEVTYESVQAFLSGKADALARAVPPAPAEPPGWTPPTDDRAREGAVRPYVVPIWERLLRLAARGVTDPSGAQLGLSPEDAKVWDGTAGRGMEQSDRAWVVADLQRRGDGRGPGAGTGAAGA